MHKSDKNLPTDSRRARSVATKNALMRAAETLVARDGIENLSKKAIVAIANQKNESALQYHFKNLTGLLRAVHAQRGEQIQAKRAANLAKTLKISPDPSLRALYILLVEPTFLLARADVEFRRYVKAFGHELAISESSALEQVAASGHSCGGFLRKALPNLSDGDFRRRMEATIRLCSASMYHQARQKNAFRGHQSDLFLHHLIDALVGLLSAPVSVETKALEQDP